MNYPPHLSAVTKAFNELGFKFSRKTHAGRASGAVMAEMGGASEESIRRQGNWADPTTCLDGSYLTHYAEEVMRAHAGWSPKGTAPGDYNIPRDVKVPPELLAQVFPAAADWCVPCRPILCEHGPLTRLAQARESEARSRRSVGVSSEVSRAHGRAAQGLHPGRALLPPAAPNHFIWSYELFNTPEWEDWERRMLAVVQAPTLVRNYALEEAAPEMFEWLRSNISPLTAQVETAIRQAQQHQNDVVPRLATLETAVQQLSSVMATVCTAVARIEGSQYEKAQH